MDNSSSRNNVRDFTASVAISLWRAGEVLGRPKFSDGDRDKLVAALETGDSWHVVSRRTRIPYSTVKKHARALGYKPRRCVLNGNRETFIG